jgi:hypothetical protein
MMSLLIWERQITVRSGPLSQNPVLPLYRVDSSPLTEIPACLWRISKYQGKTIT